MNFLIKILQNNTKFQQLLKHLETKKSPMVISGLCDVEKIHTLLAIRDKIQKPICILTYNEIQAKQFCRDIKSFGEKVWYFPKREIATYDYDVRKQRFTL